MDKHFGYFRQPTSKELETLLTSSLIAFDANVLLNLYRYSPDTRREFLDILAKSHSQLWLPHQAGLEFHRNRLTVMQAHVTQFAAARRSVEALRAQILALYRTPKSAPAAKKSPAESAIDALLAHLEKSATDCIAPTNDISKDSVWREVVALFGDSVGDPYDETKAAELYKEASERFDVKRPPGYEDGGKPAPDRYGDFILWRQVTDKALNAQRPVVLVTDDRKADWWAMLDGKNLGPLPALREEMRRLADQPFHMYNPGLFMAKMAARFKVTASQPALAEVRSLPPIPASSGSLQRRTVNARLHAKAQYVRAIQQLEDATARSLVTRRRLDQITAEVAHAGVSPALMQEMLATARGLNEARHAAAAAQAALAEAEQRRHLLAAADASALDLDTEPTWLAGPTGPTGPVDSSYLVDTGPTWLAGPTGPIDGDGDEADGPDEDLS